MESWFNELVWSMIFNCILLFCLLAPNIVYFIHKRFFSWKTESGYTEEDIKKAYAQGSFDGNTMAKRLHREIKSYSSPEEYLKDIKQK